MVKKKAAMMKITINAPEGFEFTGERRRARKGEFVLAWEDFEADLITKEKTLLEYFILQKK